MVYTQENLSQDKFKRIFSVDVDSNELQWHRDAKNRLVEVIQGGDWKFQIEDELPITLTDDMTLYISKEVYHRVIKGSDDLIILITEEKE
jgi:hypothetical protein